MELVHSDEEAGVRTYMDGDSLRQVEAGVASDSILVEYRAARSSTAVGGLVNFLDAQLKATMAEADVEVFGGRRVSIDRFMASASPKPGESEALIAMAQIKVERKIWPRMEDS